MGAAALIVFRETLEAALLIGIVAAATHGLLGRQRWLVGGVAAGALGAVLIALLAQHSPELFGDAGQDLFNAGVLGIAVLMLAWHNIWMARHGAQMAREARAVAAEVTSGRRSGGAIALLVGLAVLREGAETVLFMLGLTAGGGLSAGSAWAGFALGIAGGALLGYVIYAGLLRIPLRTLFSVTGALLLLIAAGMAAQAARFLIQSDVLPPLASPLWDTSALLPTRSALGSVLHLLIGYDAQPSGMQVLCFVLVFVLIALGARWARPPAKSAAASSLAGSA